MAGREGIGGMKEGKGSGGHSWGNKGGEEREEEEGGRGREGRRREGGGGRG